MIRIVPGRILAPSARRSGPAALFIVLALASPRAANGAGPEFWDTYGFVEPYAGRRADASGDSPDAWKAGVRAGRVGWLTGWEGDLSVDRGEDDEPDRYQASVDGFLKAVETRISAILVVVGIGGTRLHGGPDPDESVFFHYRYGVAYRARFSERTGLRLDLTAMRSSAGDFSSREAALGWVTYF